MFFVLLRPILCEKWKIAPPFENSPPSNVWICEIGRNISLNFGEDLFFSFFFFGDHLILGEKNLWISEFGRKITLNFGEDLFFFFFGDHLILGGEKLWISEFGRKITLNFGEDLFFFFFGDHLILGGEKLWISELSETFRLKFRTNRLKLIQDQWNFESRSFAHFSLFQNSPPPFPNPGYAPERYTFFILSNILALTNFVYCFFPSRFLFNKLFFFLIKDRRHLKLSYCVCYWFYFLTWIFDCWYTF